MLTILSLSHYDSDCIVIELASIENALGQPSGSIALWFRLTA